MKDIKKNRVWTTIVLVMILLGSFTYADEPVVGLPPPLPSCGDVNYAQDCLQATYQVVTYDALSPVEITQPTADAVYINSKLDAIEKPAETTISGSMTYARARDIVTNMQYGPVILSQAEATDLKGAFRTVFADQSKVPSIQKEVRVLYDRETRTASVEQKTKNEISLTNPTSLGPKKVVLQDEKWEVRAIDANTLEQDAAAAKITNNNPLLDESKRATSTTTLSAVPLKTKEDIQTASASQFNQGGAQGATTTVTPGVCISA